MPKNPEDKLQIAVATYLDLLSRTKKFRWCHVPNGGARSKVEAGIFKAMGVKAGVPDVMIFKPKWRQVGKEEVHVCGLAIELKVVYANGKKNYPSANQKEWMAYLKQVGWEVHVAYNFDDVKKIVDEYVGV